eukprot:1155993-Pelagomonas_calceolata.AAC.15
MVQAAFKLAKVPVCMKGAAAIEAEVDSLMVRATFKTTMVPVCMQRSSKWPSTKVWIPRAGGYQKLHHSRLKHPVQWLKPVCVCFALTQADMKKDVSLLSCYAAALIRVHRCVHQFTKAHAHTSILSGLALSISEVGRHGHNSVLHGLAQVGLSHVLHLGQDHGADLLRGENLRAREACMYASWSGSWQQYLQERGPEYECNKTA